MVPTQGKHKSVRACTAKSGSGARLNPRPSISPSPGDGFSSSKQDKRRIKHSSFVSKIRKAHAKPLKRRRPSKKLVTNLESLADALPDSSEVQDRDMEFGDMKIRRKSLKSRQGAMKRKEKLEKLERERFGKNMAQMVGAGEPKANLDGDGSSTTASRWAALRGYISQTMEQKDEFRAKYAQ